MSTRENIDRFNMYKGRMENARAGVIRATQFLVRPTESFPPYNLHEIESLWRLWRDEEECFWRMTTQDKPPVRSFPKMPTVGAEDCCFRMWGLLTQVQVDGTHGSTHYLRETVLQIAANEACKSHPATCSCHVPDHPWIDKEDVDALEPIKAQHRLDCRCAGWNRCAQKMAAAAPLTGGAACHCYAHYTYLKCVCVAPPPPVVAANPYTTKGFPSEFCRCDRQWNSCTCGRPDKDNVDLAMRLDASGNLTPEMGQALCGKGWVKAPKPNLCEHGFTHCVICPDTKAKTYEYKHNVETCACGTCHKSRVDSGTEAAYIKRCQDAANATIAGLSTAKAAPRAPLSIGAAIENAQAAITKASAACGGGPDHPDFAKQLFAAMGTPHDSTCPHGLPFYACMPCSH